MSTNILIPGRRGFILATGHASVVEEDKEIAWEGAHDRIVPRPDIGWVVSKYIDLSPPDALRPNRNGHVFTLADGEKNFGMIVDTPMNWLHHDQFIVGSYVASHLQYHTDDGGAPATDAVGDTGGHVETLATFYRAIYPKHWKKTKAAHDSGMLHTSMEAVPESVTCVKDGCCGETFPFKGVWSETYCDSMQKLDREFILNNPLFLGGAVVVPPAKPGWRDANSLEVATWIEKNLDEAGHLYDSIHAAHDGELDPDQIEAVLASLVQLAGLADDNAPRLPGQSYAAARLWLPPDLAALLPVEDDQVSIARRTTTLEDLANLQGVIVAMVPPPDIAEQLSALGGEPADQIHVTLAFLGDSGGEDTIEGPAGPVTKERLHAVIAVFAASEMPLTASVSGLGRFALPGDAEVTYASIDSPGLNEMRTRLIDYLHAADVPVDFQHGFSPHATLQYHLTGEGPTEIPEGLAWDVGSIELWWGSDMHAAHQLGGVGLDDGPAAMAIAAIAALEDDQLDDDDVTGTLVRFAQAARPETLTAVLAANPSPRVVELITNAVARKDA